MECVGIVVMIVFFAIDMLASLWWIPKRTVSKMDEMLAKDNIRLRSKCDATQNEYMEEMARRCVAEWHLNTLGWTLKENKWVNEKGE